MTEDQSRYKRASLDRLSQLPDEDLQAVVRVVEMAVMFGKGWLMREGRRFVAESDDQYQDRVTRRTQHRSRLRQEEATWREQAEQAQQRFEQKLSLHEATEALKKFKQEYERRAPTLTDQFVQEYTDRNT